jgi:hypothetical protein
MVWCDKAETVPPIAPSIADPTSVENNMLTPGLREMPTHRQTGLPAADYNRVYDISHANPP